MDPIGLTLGWLTTIEPKSSRYKSYLYFSFAKNRSAPIFIRGCRSTNCDNPVFIKDPSGGLNAFYAQIKRVIVGEVERCEVFPRCDARTEK